MEEITVKIKTPENRKVLYYLKSQEVKHIAEISSIDEVKESEYEVTYEKTEDKLSELFDKNDKRDLKSGLSYLIQMATAIKNLHGLEEPVAVDSLSLDDFGLYDGEVKFMALDKLIWAEPEYVAANIDSFLKIINDINKCLELEKEKNIEHLLELPARKFRTMDQVRLELQRTKEDCFRQYNKYNPVGFRNGVMANKAVALIIYIVMVNYAFHTDFSQITNWNNLVCKIIYLAIMILTAFFAGNYLGVLDLIKVTKIKNTVLRWIVRIILTIVVFFALMWIFVEVIRIR